MSALASISEEWRGDTLLTRIEGEVDASNVVAIGGRLRSLLTNHSIAMIVDLSATRYLDSAGINLLFALAEEMRAHQQRFGLVVADGSPIRRMLAVTGLDQIVEVRPTAAGAAGVIPRAS